MSLFDIFFNKKKTTAGVAKERLQIILAHERNIDDDGNIKANNPEWLSQLQNELIEVIAKYTKINADDLKVHLEKRDNIDLLEINVTLPEIK
ncbi:MAG: cell division topological specificity factor MinE [Burkholderiales bacterium]|nr:cell division topological specificity factor MinE [Burkholderiales bacterium]